MEVSRVEALHPHPPAERLGVRGESGEGDAEVVVQREDLFLVAGERGRPPLEGRQDGVRLVLEADRGRALLHGLHRVLDLVEAALRRPGRHVRVVLVTELRGRDFFLRLSSSSSTVCLQASLTILKDSAADLEDNQLPMAAMMIPFTAIPSVSLVLEFCLLCLVFGESFAGAACCDQ